MEFHEEYLQHLDKLDKLKIEQKKLRDELKLAYDYKDDLIGKMQFADKQISDKQHEYHKMLMSVQLEITKMKIAFDQEVSRLSTE